MTLRREGKTLGMKEGHLEWRRDIWNGGETFRMEEGTFGIEGWTLYSIYLIQL